ncbi:MAG: hypothetical protein ACYC9Z_15810 [Casimicrobiaceae bacterium]
MFGLNARHTRAVTGLALDAWLFALVVGIVHACSLGELGVTPGERGVTSASASVSGEAHPSVGVSPNLHFTRWRL